MIHVVASHEGPNTVAYITQDGSFNRRIPSALRQEIAAWMVAHWGTPNAANAWEFYDQTSYLSVRVHNPNHGVELRLRWHGVES